ncbi:DUF4012 domain-containing protein [Candidatus Uhrbacteria bacterium]|nr:DUF4012 domain-containing protein [Candidatus Uhrbacteria bacterium]
MPRAISSTPRPRRTASRVKRDSIPPDHNLPELLGCLPALLSDRNLTAFHDEATGTLHAWEPLITYHAPPDRTAHTPITSSLATTPAPLTPKVGVAAPVPNRIAIPIAAGTAPQRSTSAPMVTAPGARTSTAPLPFAVPIDARLPRDPSRHVIALTRPAPQRRPIPTPALDLAASVRTQIAARLPQQSPVTTLRLWWQQIRTRSFRISVSPTPSVPAPAIAVRAPYDELLICTVCIGTMDTLWRELGWPIWQFFRLPHPHTLRTQLRLWWWARTLPYRALPALSPASNRLCVAPVRIAPVERTRIQFRHAATFALTLTLTILPLKIFGLSAELPAIRSRVLGATAHVLDGFATGAAAVQQSSFQQAITDFNAARTTLDNIAQIAGPASQLGLAASRHVPFLQSTIGRAEDARRAAIALADASSAATRGIALLTTIDPQSPDSRDALRAATAAFHTARTRADAAAELLPHAAPALVPTITRAQYELRRVESLLPILTALAGMDRPRRILLVFQNPAELRPTGGFMGSIALLDVANGTVQNFELPGGGSYDISGQSRLRVLPPEPLRLLTSTWQFHDANWFPDFPTSARQLRTFYIAGGGPSVDAVIAVNAPLLSDILALTGPVTVGERSFGAADVLTAITDTVESAAARRTGQPKAILGALAPELLRRLTTLTMDGDTSTRLLLLDRLLRAFDERDVLVHFSDDAVQRAVATARWDGAVHSAPRDSLFVVHANIGGGKTDTSIRTNTAHTANLRADGSIVDTLRITRTHEGTPAPVGTPASARLAGLHHLDYIRVYVPRGATLLSAQGFQSPDAAAFEPIPTDAIPDRTLLATELTPTIDPRTGIRITEEFGHTVFGGWLQIDPGTSTAVQLTYVLPWQIERTRTNAIGTPVPADPQSYSLAVQKQPGMQTTFQHSFTIDPSWRTTWIARNLHAQGTRTWNVDDLLTTDLFTGALVAPKN